MRRLHASSGFRHSFTEGPSPLAVFLIIRTKLIIRVELEQKQYADGSIVYELGTDCPERISGLQALLEGAPHLPECMLLWHCALEKLLDGTRDGSNLIMRA